MLNEFSHLLLSFLVFKIRTKAFVPTAQIECSVLRITLYINTYSFTVFESLFIVCLCFCCCCCYCFLSCTYNFVIFFLLYFRLYFVKPKNWLNGCHSFSRSVSFGANAFHDGILLPKRCSSSAILTSSIYPCEYVMKT